MGLTTQRVLVTTTRWCGGVSCGFMMEEDVEDPRAEGPGVQSCLWLLISGTCGRVPPFLLPKKLTHPSKDPNTANWKHVRKHMRCAKETPIFLKCVSMRSND